ncbi:hypothetical protein [Brevundimonas sp.]|uniref:hypothetical protein n=1 Tax=Brevundimonas sp. TaxID=1871086 RepID=UPI002D4D2965|nr:hypothetical protein [Brevundimonas sp.]HYC73639.1 hypothetical protein [Brevundimonas sp.]
MLVDNDPGARRNHGDAAGLWVINVLVGALVAVLSLYTFRAEGTRHDARTAMAAIEVLPGHLAASPAMAAAPED